MTHDARISRESDVARVIPTRKENISPANGNGGEKNIFSLSPDRLARRAKCAERIGYWPTSGL